VITVGVTNENGVKSTREGELIVRLKGAEAAVEQDRNVLSFN
jgi:hypothetical protein